MLNNCHLSIFLPVIEALFGKLMPDAVFLGRQSDGFFVIFITQIM